MRTSPFFRPRAIHRRTGPGPLLAMTLAAAAALAGTAGAQDEEDVSVENLYRSAASMAVEGNYEGAVANYVKLFDLAGEFLCEDFGPQAGGIVFDYGSVLLQLQDWEGARDAFERCHRFREVECQKTKVQNENSREVLALFQWGFCEAQLGDHARALELYDQYFELAKTDPAELAKVRSAFKLRRGTSLVKLGRVEEGGAEIRELFDKREEWQVTPQFLMQGLLELGLGWVELAKGAGEDQSLPHQIEAQAHVFLDANGAVLDVSPVDKYRFGFLDRLKKLGFESAEAGMPTLALRFYSLVPTLEDVDYDVRSRIQVLPGQSPPAAFQQMLDQVAEQQAKPVSPDLEMQRLVARSWELIGNYHAPREIYRHLVEANPEIQAERRAEMLHEAARFSTMLGDYSSAQYFGEIFMAEMPDHRLRDNVSVFMLQSLFSSQQFEEVVRVCEVVRERFELGDEQRELPDALYGLALYSLGRYQDAQVAFDDYAKSYQGTPNREMVLYHRANNRMILGDFRLGADLALEFQQEYPSSERFGDLSLADLALCRYNLEDYTAAIAAVDKLEEEFPATETLDRALNIKADALIVRSGDVLDEEEGAKLREQGLQAYLQAIEVGRRLEARGRVPEQHKASVAEAIAKAADLKVEDEAWEEAVALYDSFFPDYAGTFFEPQLSVFTIPALEQVGRAEDGLAQLERMVNVLGGRPPEDQDLDLLRRCIGSYSEVSVRVRGEEKTIETLGAFPGLDPTNQALLTWLKMQRVIVLQGMRAAAERDSTEYASLTERIDQEFREMELFEVRQLSEIALKMIGDYLSGSDNPFLGVRYYEDLLIRDNPDADQYKGSADLGLGRIEARRADSASQNSARERFLRVINQYNDRSLIPEAWLELGRVDMKLGRWEDAREAFSTINQEKRWLKPEERAESNYNFGQVLEQLGDPAGAFLAYNAVWITYSRYHEWSTTAFEKWVELGLSDADANLEDPVARRAKKIEFYKWLKRKVIEWSAFPDTEAMRRLQLRVPELRAELGITTEEEAAINFQLGLNPDGTLPPR